MHDLDRPVWASLTTHHAPMAVGGDLARRYPGDVNLFASTRDDEDADALAALADLLVPGEQAYVLQVPPVRVPPGCRVLMPGHGVQMIAARPLQDDADEDVLALGDADAPDMLALAQLTRPGPAHSWRARTRWARSLASASTVSSRRWPANACGFPGTPR